MKQEKEKPVKAYEFFCKNTECNYEWIAKTDDCYCPKCKGVILDFQKLR
jgi:Zn finger protein HypA/HybF involved in hydrogenase expression